MSSILEYAGPRSLSEPDRHLRIAVLCCGLTPLAVGFSILLGYFVTHSAFFPPLGFAWLFVGTLIVIIGAVLLLVYLVQALRSRQSVSRTLVECFLLAALLLSNFPAAGLCIRAADHVDSSLGIMSDD
jgi:hypothetical protein